MTSERLLDSLTSHTRMLTTTQLADLLQTTKATLHGWCRASKLPCTRMPDNSYRFDPLAVRSWLIERTA
jgi:hypothetical protein